MVFNIKFGFPFSNLSKIKRVNTKQLFSIVPMTKSRISQQLASRFIKPSKIEHVPTTAPWLILTKRNLYSTFHEIKPLFLMGFNSLKDLVFQCNFSCRRWCQLLLNSVLGDGNSLFYLNGFSCCLFTQHKEVIFP
jgi:PAB1-binding protein PBP1